METGLQGVFTPVLQRFKTLAQCCSGSFYSFLYYQVPVFRQEDQRYIFDTFPLQGLYGPENTFLCRL